MTFLQPQLTIEQMIGITTGPPTLQETAVQVYRQLYDGQEQVVLSDRQQLYIVTDSSLPQAFSNSVKLVVNKLRNRCKIKRQGQGIQPIDDSSEDFAEMASQWWKQTNIDAEQSELMTFLLRDGQAALFVEWLGDSSGGPVVAARPIWAGGQGVENNSGVRFHTLDVWDEVVEFASYRWQVEEWSADGETVTQIYTRLNVYQPGLGEAGALVYRYWSTDDNSWTPLSTEQIQAETGEPFANPQELLTPHIPIVRFQNPGTESEVRELARLEQLRQKSFGDVDIAADLYAMPAVAADEMEPTIDENGNPEPMQVTPGHVLVAKNAKRLEGADLVTMWNGTLKPYLMEMGLLKSFPVWILNPQDNAVPSGTSLKVQERDLVALIETKQEKLVVPWQMTFHVLKMTYNAYNPGQALDPDSRLLFEWVSPATESVIEDRAIEVNTAQQAGLSEESIWRRVYGYSDEEVEEEYRRLQQDTESLLRKAQIVQALVTSTFNSQAAMEIAGLAPDQILALSAFGNAPEEDGRQAGG